jgi:hypothetical protein
MAIYFLNKKQLAEKFGKELSKKEIKAQAEGSTITVNGDRIVILSDHVSTKNKTQEKVNIES